MAATSTCTGSSSHAPAASLLLSPDHFRLQPPAAFTLPPTSAQPLTSPPAGPPLTAAASALGQRLGLQREKTGDTPSGSAEAAIKLTQISQAERGLDETVASSGLGSWTALNRQSSTGTNSVVSGRGCEDTEERSLSLGQEELNDLELSQSSSVCLSPVTSRGSQLIEKERSLDQEDLNDLDACDSPRVLPAQHPHPLQDNNIGQPQDTVSPDRMWRGSKKTSSERPRQGSSKDDQVIADILQADEFSQAQSFPPPPPPPRSKSPKQPRQDSTSNDAMLAEMLQQDEMGAAYSHKPVVVGVVRTQDTSHDAILAMALQEELSASHYHKPEGVGVVGGRHQPEEVGVAKALQEEMRMGTSYYSHKPGGVAMVGRGHQPEGVGVVSRRPETRHKPKREPEGVAGGSGLDRDFEMARRLQEETDAELARRMQSGSGRGYHHSHLVTGEHKNI